MKMCPCIQPQDIPDFDNICMGSSCFVAFFSISLPIVVCQGHIVSMTIAIFTAVHRKTVVVFVKQL